MTTGHSAKRFITISTDTNYWGDTSSDPNFNVFNEVSKISDAAESQGIIVLPDEYPRIVYDAEGNELDQIDWFSTWCNEGDMTGGQWREFFSKSEARKI